MQTYESVLKSVKESINKNSFVFPIYNNLDYTGIDFEYNLKKTYPKSIKNAKKDTATPYFDKLLKKIEKNLHSQILHWS